MTDNRYPSAVQRAKAKLAGDDRHPADGQHRDPLDAQLADLVDKPAKKARLRAIGGSDHDGFNGQIANAALFAARWTTNEAKDAAATFVGQALAGIAPTDEIEGMLAAQMVAAHQMSMECHRRGMLEGQTVEGRAMNLKHGAKASQTFATLLDALNRHRGKGQQKVTVEHIHRHVHVHGSEQSVIDHAPGAAGDQSQIEQQPHAPALSHQPQFGAEMRSQDKEREPLPRTGDAERTLSNARRRQPRRAQGAG